MEENIKEKAIKLAIEAMRPLPVNSFAGYCGIADERSPEEKHKDDMRFCKEFNELQSEMLITLARKVEIYLDDQIKDNVESGKINHPSTFPDGRNCCIGPYIDSLNQMASTPFGEIDKKWKESSNNI